MTVGTTETSQYGLSLKLLLWLWNSSHDHWRPAEEWMSSWGLRCLQEINQIAGVHLAFSEVQLVRKCSLPELYRTQRLQHGDSSYHTIFPLLSQPKYVFVVPLKVHLCACVYVCVCVCVAALDETEKLWSTLSRAVSTSFLCSSSVLTVSHSPRQDAPKWGRLLHLPRFYFSRRICGLQISILNIQMTISNQNTLQIKTANVHLHPVDVEFKHSS